MFDSRGFLLDIIGYVHSILGFYTWLIIIRALLSWVRPDPYNPIVRFLDSITEPFLSFIRRLFPRLLWGTGIDFSPFIAIAFIEVIRYALRRIII